MKQCVLITILFMEVARIEECGEGDLSGLVSVAIAVLHRITQPAQLVADCMEERTDGECIFYSAQHPPPSNATFCSLHCARWRRRDLQAIIHLIFAAPTNDCGGGDASPGLDVLDGYL